MLKPSLDPKDLKTRVREILPEITEIRRGLHRIPEIKLEERETSKRIRELVDDTRIDLLEPYIGTDVVGLLWGTKSDTHRDAADRRGTRGQVDGHPPISMPSPSRRTAARVGSPNTAAELIPAATMVIWPYWSGH